MALGIWKGNLLPIGADLGSGQVKLAQLRLNGSELELLAAGAEELPGYCRNDAHERMRVLANCIRAILKSKPFKGRHCVMALPASAMFVYHVKIPKLPPEQTLEALRLELQNKLPGNVDDMVMRHVVAGDVSGEGRSKQEVIVIACPRDTLETYLAMARRAKLDVVSINAPSCAIVECFAHLLRRSADSSRTMLFIDIGATCTQVVLSHGPQIAFSRALPIGGEQFDQVVAQGMGMPPHQASALRRQASNGELDQATQQELYHLLEAKIDELAGEVAQCLRYHESVFKNRQVERAIFLGGQAYDKRLCQLLAERLNVPATIGDPLTCIKRAEGAAPDAALDQRQPHPNWAVAIGLSLGAMKAA